MSPRVALVLAAGLIAGCAKTELNSTLGTAEPQIVGTSTLAVPLAQADAELVRLQTELDRRIASRDWGMPLQLSRGAEPWLRLRLGADESFEPGTAQLRAQALGVYAAIGDLLRTSPGFVAHVLVHGDEAEPDLAAGLTARRAASIMNYLATRSVPVTRLRAEGRGATDPATFDAGAGAVNRRVDVVLKLVITGSEADAWLPPPMTGCGSCQDADG
ncbi:MAG TPA: OmpA family protein [Verrucomicrobiae bacterium]|nr:OmpA family protein [Verrucomicrobiae bacterium]